MSASPASPARPGGVRRGRVLAGLLAAVLLALVGCSTGDDAVATNNEFTFVAPGGQTTIRYAVADRQASPDLTGESLLEAGKQIKVSDFANQVVVINVWGTWCPPCRAEASELEQVYTNTKDSGVAFLGIDLKDTRSAAEDFVRNNNLTYPSIFDPSGRSLLALNGYPRNAVPSTIVLDRQHRVAAVFLTGLLASDLEPVVKEIAAES
ncbi:TlpA family protein disulfide reductase [Goodfellowiella coeruleoviolacea]|uniref:Thiol-disulfide isomerase or thioredoxin n=1 Tax=Goodfellowiella coeruleoviolacea TaxID=334858 RepID=A0AAE3GD11_9PSEU|nr:TlpA disulfide reductase family protein [Goodfellowiella coeruleoviolacea]MCP2165976.1 Thiol-disulfide isomerase or thioredoxin [Goodfellowiella coeruleoviolacea]